MTDDDIFADLQHDLTATGPTVAKNDRPRYNCHQCNGTGKWWDGRRHSRSRKCYACNGEGYFYSSQADRQKQRSRRAARKQQVLADNQADFLSNPAHSGLITSLHTIQDWNNFAQQMITAFNTYGHLTERQVIASLNMLTKIEANKQRQIDNAVTVDLSPIRAMFEKAQSNGLKRPTYRAEDLIISLANPTSLNAGCLYVKTMDGDYQGKITPDHRFLPVRSATPTTAHTLQTIAEDPKQAAIRYGRLLGNCSICGRLLTKQTSIDAGIGPICAARFGF